MFRICPNCGDEFRDQDNGLFLNCSTCRKPLDLRKEARRKGKRFAEGSTNDGRTQDMKENTYETTHGKWHG